MTKGHNDPVGAKFSTPRQTGLPRQRLLEQCLASRLFVVAPGGSGKSTLLAQLAAGYTGPVWWVNLDASDSASAEFDETILKATGGFIDRTTGTWRFAAENGLLVIEDAHVLADTPAAEDLGELLRWLPDDLSVAISARTTEGLNITASQVTDRSVTLTYDDLRFRIWEIEELFTVHYGQRLSADQLHPLARNTEGWATALNLFHLASRLAPARTGALVNELRTQSYVLRQYLTEQILSELDEQELGLVRELAVFEQLHPNLVLSLVGQRGPIVVERLHALGLLSRTSYPGEYQLHSLVREQLLDQVVANTGHLALRDLHRRASEILDIHGHAEAAVRARQRAGTVASRGSPADQTQARVGTDPWMLWTTGVNQLYAGSLPASEDTLRHAREGFAAPPSELTTTTLAIASWLQPGSVAEPARPWGALKLWLAGQDPPAAVLNVDTRLPGQIFRQLTARLSGTQLPVASGSTRLATALLRISDAILDVLDGSGPRAHSLQDVELMLQTGVPCPALERLHLVLSRPQPEDDTSGILEQLKANAEVAGDALSQGLLGVIGTAADRSPTGQERTRDLLEQVGLSRLCPLVQAESGPKAIKETPSKDFYMSLTGLFKIGDLAETSANHELRPQQIAILQVLTLHAKEWLHRDQLVFWFWPHAPAEKGAHRLATALSAIRRALETFAPGTHLDRNRNLYKLEPAENTSDLAAVSSRLRTAELRATDNPIEATNALEECLQLQQGPLLASATASTWLDDARWELESRWERALRPLLESDHQDPATIKILPDLMHMVPHSDALWRLAIDLASTSGAPRLAEQLSVAYDLRS